LARQDEPTGTGTRKLNEASRCELAPTPLRIEQGAHPLTAVSDPRGHEVVVNARVPLPVMSGSALTIELRALAKRHARELGACARGVSVDRRIVIVR
jgi:hypothetical protein